MKGVKMAIRVFIKRTCEDPSKEKELVVKSIAGGNSAKRESIV